MTALVRVCPVCDSENPPERARCACGATLAGVDFALPRSSSSPQERGPADLNVHAEDTATTLDSRPRGIDDPGPSSLQKQGPGDVALCPHPDCGQPNPAGTARCVYSNRPLAGPAAPLDTRPLPSALRDAYRVVDVFPATGSEADILLVEDIAHGERSVVKLYRKGIDPDFRLLDILAASAGASVVRVLAHGVSDGVAYERLEYVSGGTLADYLREGPLAAADVRGIVAQIADALTRIHAHRILHRDLKPDNVLVRARQPLALALTDFGIASLAAATQHFTSVARTTRYAAPEVLTGVIDAKADWWSLGMIALEAATGRHPFEGLTEQVMNHQLATRPIDVGVVYDDALRKLCRGLLLRDPRRRFGGEEVARWLAGDPTLVAPDETAVGASVVKPYRIGGAECTNAQELAVALARHWDDACKDLARGTLARWIEQELADYNLLRALRDAQDERGIDDDTRVLRFLRAACPTLPPVWRGEPLTPETVLAHARKAVADDGDAIRWLDSVWRADALAAFPEAPALTQLDATWRDSWQRFGAAYAAGNALHDAAHQEAARRPATEGGHVDFDAVAFGARGQMVAPEAHDVHGALLLAAADPDYLQALRAEVATARARLVDRDSWLETLVVRIGDDPPGLVAVRAFLAVAQADDAAARVRETTAERARAQQIAETAQGLRVAVKALLDAAPEDDDISAATASSLEQGFTRLQALCQQLSALDLSADAHAALRTAVEKIEVQAFGVQRALAALAHDRSVTAMFLDARRLPIVFFVLVIALLTRNGWVILAAVALPSMVAVYRWYTRFEATDAVLAALRRFRLPARSLMGDEAAASPASARGRKKARGSARA